MLDKQVIEIFELLDSSYINGVTVKKFFLNKGAQNIKTINISTDKGNTDFIEILIKGINGKSSGGTAKTLGIIGRLGGIGARKKIIGMVSDADGCIAALATALKLIDMQNKGDILEGDVIISTHICPNAPTQPHDPVPFMGSPVDMSINNKYEVKKEMDAILSIDTTKGNRTLSHKGIMISPTVKNGYILRISEDLVSIIEIVTGKLAKIFPLTTQDITPYGNGLWHLNSIVQPCTSTEAPVVGVAITSEMTVPGCATGASHLKDIELASRFALETAKYYSQNKINFYNEEEYKLLTSLYGSMEHLKTLGKS